MASFVYDNAKEQFMLGTLDLDETGDDMRIIMVMSNSTADTEKDKTTIVGGGGPFTTLDECDGANYARKALASQTVTEDGANNRAEFDATNITWTALGVGTRQNIGLVLFKFVTTDADSIPIAYIDTGGFPFDASGGDVTINWNAEGILHLT